MLTKPGLILRIEGGVLLAVSLLFYRESHSSWALFAALFLVPDLSFLGYLAGVKVGAAAYNIAHTSTGPLILIGRTTIGSTQIQPGQYELRAEEGKSEIQVIQRNRVIAKVPIQWTKLPTKAQSAEILTDGTKVTEVEFAGRNEAAQIRQ